MPNTRYSSSKSTSTDSKLVRYPIFKYLCDEQKEGKKQSKYIYLRILLFRCSLIFQFDEEMEYKALSDKCDILMINRPGIKMLRIVLIAMAFVLSNYAFAGEKGKSTAVIKFSSLIHDFGQINEYGGEVTYDFTFVNKGNKALVIDRVKTSCECTLARYGKKSVLPGKSGKITVIFSPVGVSKKFRKNVYVYSNGSREPVTLQIKGNVAHNK